ncbi:MAG: methylglyoxal synthase [Rhizobiales bacterium]|nr:methylglyoxal synthase [Hyphomicrobiales bacterium]
MHVVTVLFVVKPEYADSFQLVVRQQGVTSLTHSHGCRRFDVSFDQNCEQVFLYELYDRAEDFQNHLKTPHFLSFSQKTKDWIVSKEVREWSLADGSSDAAIVRPGLGLVAHESCKDRLAGWVQRNESAVRQFEIYSTENTGRVVEQRCPSLRINRLVSGPQGGDLQMGSLIVEGRVQTLLFFVDPLAPQPHDVDVKALTRVAVLKNVRLAMNESTADRLLAHRACS